MKEFAAYSASVAIGLCLGLIGAGGSILTIPVFVYILKTDPVSATIYSMFIVGICSLVGSIKSCCKKLVDIKVAILFGIPSVAGVFIARKLLFPALPEKFFSVGSFIVTKNIFIMLSLAVVMFSASAKMLQTQAAAGIADKNRQCKIWMFLVQGLFVGIVTGLLGVGGGFLIVPALLVWVRLPMKAAIGTTLLIITINSAAGFVSSYTAVVIEWPLLLKFAIGAIAGILGGIKLAEKIPAANLKKLLGWFIMVTSVYVLYRQFEGAKLK